MWGHWDGCEGVDESGGDGGGGGDGMGGLWRVERRSGVCGRESGGICV